MSAIKVEIFRATQPGWPKGRWRWRVIAANNKTLAECDEGYSTKPRARAAMRQVACAFLDFLADEWSHGN